MNEMEARSLYKTDCSRSDLIVNKRAVLRECRRSYRSAVLVTPTHKLDSKVTSLEVGENKAIRKDISDTWQTTRVGYQQKELNFFGEGSKEKIEWFAGAVVCIWSVCVLMYSASNCCLTRNPSRITQLQRYSSSQLYRLNYQSCSTS